MKCVLVKSFMVLYLQDNQKQPLKTQMRVILHEPFLFISSLEAYLFITSLAACSMYSESASTAAAKDARKCS